MKRNQGIYSKARAWEWMNKRLGQGQKGQNFK